MHSERPGDMLGIVESDNDMWQLLVGLQARAAAREGHRVNLDWLFERISKDPGIFVKYVPTKEQIEDILTKGSFTADAWR